MLWERAHRPLFSTPRRWRQRLNTVMLSATWQRAIASGSSLKLTLNGSRNFWADSYAWRSQRCLRVWSREETERPFTIIKQNVPGRSRLRLGVESSCTEQRASYAGGELLFAAQRPLAEEMSEDILPFPLSTCPTTAEISLSLEAGRAQHG